MPPARGRASMGCRHSAPVDPSDTPANANRPKLYPPSRHGAVVPTARDRPHPQFVTGQQLAPLPRRSSSRTGGLGRIGRGGAGGRQSKAEFDAALTVKLERLAVSMEATDSGKEGAVSEAVVEMATPDGKSQQNGTRRGVSVEATTHPGDAVADWARRADAYLESRDARSGGAVVEGYGRARLNRPGDTGWVGEEREKPPRQPRLSNYKAGTSSSSSSSRVATRTTIDRVPFSRTQSRGATSSSNKHRASIEPVPVSRTSATGAPRKSSSTSHAYLKPTIASTQAASSASDPVVVTKHFVWDPTHGLRRRVDTDTAVSTNATTYGPSVSGGSSRVDTDTAVPTNATTYGRSVSGGSSRATTPPTPPTVAPVKLWVHSPPRVVAPMSDKMRCLRAKLPTLRIPGEESGRRATQAKSKAVTQQRLRPSSHLYPTY